MREYAHNGIELKMLKIGTFFESQFTNLSSLVCFPVFNIEFKQEFKSKKTYIVYTIGRKRLATS